MWRRLIVSCVSITMIQLRSTIATTCAAVNTLTSSCEDLCYPGRPCIAFASNSLSSCQLSNFNTCINSTTTGCSFSCLKYGVNDNIIHDIVEYSKFTFLIPYNGYKSPWELKWDDDDKNAAATQPLINDTSLYPSINDTILDAIGSLQFRPSMKELTIVGGSSLMGGVRGRVVDVRVAPSFLVDQTNLQVVTLANIQLEQLPLNSFPSQLVNLTIRNGVLSQCPSDLETLKQLVQLDLSKNYIKTYPMKFGGLKQLQVLNLSQNSLESFEGEGLQALVSLDLSDNLLTSLPSVLFTFSNLQTLDLRKNSFSNVMFTPSQIQFLSNLTSFQADQLGVSTDCRQTSSLHGIEICIQSSNKGGGNQKALIGGLIGGLVIIIIILFSILLYRRSHRTSNRSSIHKSETGDPDETFISNRVGSIWNDQELLSLQVNANDIQDVRKLGSGAFCIVYLVMYRGHRLVASKRLKRDECNPKNIKLFIAEIKLVSRLDHPRIVSFVGIAWTIEADLQALFEYMEQGDVRGYLETTERRWSNEKLQIAIDTIEALVYVHSFTVPIVHRDLKSRNILLDPTYRAKLCDFGVARYRSDDNTMTTGVGTGRWLAPEVITGTSDYGQACDIFSFGVVLSELDTHALPYEDVRGPSGNRIADVALLQMVAAGTIIPSFTSTCPSELYQLAIRCLALNAPDRPTAVEIAYALRMIQRKYFN